MTTPHHGHQPPIRLRKAHERLVHALALALFVSGVAWLILEHFVRVEGAFGPDHHWSQSWILKLHGVLAMLGVWGFGVLWTFHIRRAWRLKRHRKSGGTMFTTVFVLIVTGLLLYYAGGERLRAVDSLVHWIVGLAGGVALIVHAVVVPARERRARSVTPM